MFFLNQRNHRHFINHPRDLIGKTAIVTIRIEKNRKGQVYIGGTWYSSLCQENIIIETDTIVEIIGYENYTLYVKPN